MPARDIDEMFEPMDELHKKYRFPSQVGEPNPIFPIYTFEGKKYILNAYIRKYIMVTGIENGNYSYVEKNDEEIETAIEMLYKMFGINATPQYFEMTEEQATMIEKVDEDTPTHTR